MKKKSFNSLLVVAAVLSCITAEAQTLRPPAYPLITHDPYFSIWSTTDKLTDSPTRHWTGKPQSLEGIVRVDGKAYQFLGSVPTTYTDVLPSGESKPYTAKYTFDEPGNGWEKPDYNATGWKTGPGPFGDTPDAKTSWKNSRTNKNGIYVRREFTYDGKMDPAKLLLSLNHDDEVTIYLNGTRILNKSGYISEYIYLPLSPEGQKALRPGKNVLAVHCVSPYGGSFIDVGIVNPVVSSAMTVATQTDVKVAATQTDYTFTAGPVDLHVNFLSPLLLDELEIVARPVSYVTFDARSTDGKAHTVQVYFGESATVATNVPSQDVVTKTGQGSGLTYSSVGTKAQPVLGRKGDNVRIDWGYAYLAVPQGADGRVATGQSDVLKKAFLAKGQLPTGSKSVADMAGN
ncbi:MAG: DUF5127 domain-containing protein, partial [Cytophagaceae bacterium]